MWKHPLYSKIPDIIADGVLLHLRPASVRSRARACVRYLKVNVKSQFEILKI